MPPWDECKNYMAQGTNVDRSILNVKHCKDQLKGENWEAHDFSVPS